MFKSALNPLHAAALAVAVAGCASAFQTSSESYRFELVDSQVRASDTGVQLRVRLVRLPDNRPVTGAEIYGQRLGMWMSGYKTTTWRMTAAVGPAEAEGNGVYRLRAELPMAGEWSLSLSARVPGEARPVRGTVRVRAS
ncbi:FixH family protein [Siccirubricoccus sp. KC 17139]|uniref:FixH family protein n=1 Tax=Siccirubricoccus soli TaxID=2899147 RepID=A0ABT1D2P7_9PROT|nr:FixH family protein [Siccirubricoccus soli]MCO6416172.1 FixH family protein [Siccirubricoccus soli]MCP2682306.1 FixH family protein [Siccirubricoccus soli]